MKSYGSLWRLAIAHILATSPDVQGSLYLERDGTLSIIAATNDEAVATAPEGSEYVITFRPGTSPEQAAAALANAASKLGR